MTLEPSGNRHWVYFSNAVNSRDQLDITWMELNENQPVEGSRYAQAYQNIDQCYFDLSSAAAILARAWAINVQFDDPPLYVDVWMSPIEENSVNGKLTFFTDFEVVYPGVRPRVWKLACL